MSENEKPQSVVVRVNPSVVRSCGVVHAQADVLHIPECAVSGETETRP